MKLNQVLEREGVVKLHRDQQTSLALSERTYYAQVMTLSHQLLPEYMPKKRVLDVQERRNAGRAGKARRGAWVPMLLRFYSSRSAHNPVR